MMMITLSLTDTPIRRDQVGMIVEHGISDSTDIACARDGGLRKNTEYLTSGNQVFDVRVDEL